MTARLVACLLLVPSALAAQAVAAPATDSAAVLAVVTEALERLSAEDRVGFTDLMMEGSTIAAAGTRRNGRAFARLRTREAARAEVVSADLLERGFDAEVRISGPLAMVWLPYDFYTNGEWSHCGVDVFTLLRTEAGWRISSLAYSVEQPPACRAHPDGAP